MKNQIQLLLLLSLFVLSCNSDDEVKILTTMLSEVWVHDIDNNEIASDLRIAFELNSTNGLNNIQLFISKENPTNEINIDYLNSLGNNGSTIVPLTKSLLYNIELNSDQVDTDNEALQHDQSYFVYLYSKDLGIINKAELLFLFSDNKIYAGSYAGRWDDTLFGSTVVSIDLKFSSNNTYRGKTYISSDFTPTYGGSDDGITTVEIVDNNIITFKYLQNAPNYRGGCPGNYKGSGSIDNDFLFEVDFTGDDCDGHHDNAQFVLKRVWNK